MKASSELRQLPDLALHQRRKGLAQQLPAVAEVLRGSLVERYVTCGNRACKCAKWERHGPMWYLTVTQDGVRLVSPEDPALPGETVAIFCTGLGRLQAATSSGQRETQIKPVVRFHRYGSSSYSELPASYAGAVAGWPGLYQVNLEVPETAASYSWIEIVVNGVESNRVLVPAR